MEDQQGGESVPPESTSSAARFHRAPALRRSLGDINPESDIRIRLLCRIIDKTVNGAIVEDAPQQPSGSAPAPQMEVMLEQDILAALKPDDIVRIFARVLPLESGFELRGELVQDMSQLDTELHKKVFKSEN